MVPIQGLPYHVVDSALREHFILVALLPKQVVEAKAAFLVGGIILEGDLPSIEADGKSRIPVVLLHFCWEEGPDADCSLDGRHLSFIIVIP